MSDTPLDLPGGSFDVATLDTALAAAHAETDPVTRQQAVVDAIAKANATTIDTQGLPPGYRRVKRQTTFFKGEVNELTITENVVVLDLPEADDVDEHPVAAADKAPADPPVEEATIIPVGSADAGTAK